jgi:phosphatidylserine decarboxylase
LSSSTGSSGAGGKRPKFSQRLGEAMRNSKITWYQIPVGLGIGFLGLIQFYRVSSREQERRAEDEGEGGRPRKRQRVRPEGPWYVVILQLPQCPCLIGLT